jgi:16S rRNA (cytosine1402-N4)-methyltransferase
MNQAPFTHQPVMVAEVIEALAPRDGALILDATFGAGGYAIALLEAAPCRVLGVDRDPEACRRAQVLVERYGERLSVVHCRFGDLLALGEKLGVPRLDGIAFDLGVSSPQLDAPERGFSFRYAGPLDMRMDTSEATTAADAVNRLPQAELADLLFGLGEERASRRIAAAIVRARAEAPILDTARLAGIVRRVLPRAGDDLDPATRTFQALRIWVNDELGELDRGLLAAERLLAPGGRLVVVAFHSLEDRRVKAFLRLRSGRSPGPSRHRLEAAPMSVREPSFRLITTRALRPTTQETAHNPRARSARLRAAERTGAPAWGPSPGPTSSETSRRAA